MSDYTIQFYVEHPEDDQPDIHLIELLVEDTSEKKAEKLAQKLVPTVFDRRKELTDWPINSQEEIGWLVIKYEPKAELRRLRKRTKEFLNG